MYDSFVIVGSCRRSHSHISQGQLCRWPWRYGCHRPRWVNVVELICQMFSRNVMVQDMWYYCSVNLFTYFVTYRDVPPGVCQLCSRFRTRTI